MPPSNFDDQLDTYILKHLEPRGKTRRLSLLVNGNWITGDVPLMPSGPDQGKLAWGASQTVTLENVTVLIGGQEPVETRWLFIRRDHITAYEWIADEPDFSSFSISD